MEGDHEPRRWGATEMLLTILGVLGGVAVGAWIFYLARSSPEPKRLAGPIGGLAEKIDQIKGLIRTANKSDNAVTGLTNASYALALLDDAEATYGAALAQACDVNKLRRLIQKVQDRHGKMLGPAAA